MNNELNSTADFNRQIHFLGRLTVAVCLFCFIMLPIILSWIYNAPIDYAQTLENAIPILLMFTFTAISENLSYAPVIGPGALYTSCVTGDLSNMKVPAALSAMKLSKVDPGTEKGDIVSILASSTCTFVTAAIAFMGMLFLANFIDPIYNHALIKPAFDCIVPAIMGSILVPILVKKPLESIPVLVLTVGTYLIVGAAVWAKISSYAMLILAILSIGYSYLLNRKKLEAAKASQE